MKPRDYIKYCEKRKILTTYQRETLKSILAHPGTENKTKEKIATMLADKKCV